jgi:predicted small metal-binding protein
VYEHRCANIGADSCRGVFRAETMTALLKMVADHATQRHNVKAPTTTLMSYVARMAKQV